MLLSEAPGAPLKAIDFGLAVFFDPGQLPRTDLGLEGTPWFMAPEALSSAVWPASDVWSAGVLAYQLLSGKLPFDDRKPRGGAPALSAVWRSVLGDEPPFAGAAWAGVSAEARAFVAALLVKDPALRPSAREALRHPWLQDAFHAGRARPLAATVVQRIQRFAQTDALRRTILELIAEELLKAAPLRLSPPGGSMHGGSAHGDGGSAHGGGACGALAAAAAAAASPPWSAAAGGFGRAPSDAQLMFPMSPDRGGGGLAAAAAAAAPAAGLRHSGSDASSTDAGARRGSLDARRGSLDLSAHGGSAGGSLHLGRSPSASALSVLARAAARAPEGSVHAPGEVLRALRAATAPGSVHGRGAYSQAERAAARRASRLALDTSAHGGARYREFLERLERAPGDGGDVGAIGAAALRGSRSMGQLSASAPPERGGALAMDADAAEAPLPAAAFPEAAAPMEVDTGLEQGGRGRSAALAALLSGGEEAPADGGGAGAPPPEAPAPAAARSASAELPPVKKVAFAAPRSARAQPSATAALTAAAAPAPAPAPDADAEPDAEPAGPLTAPADLELLMRRLRFRPGAPLSAAALADGLRSLGYDLEPSEVAALLEALEPGAGGAALAPGRFVASQLDWAELPRAGAGAAEMWLECARAAFEGLDADSDGRVAPAALLAALRAKLPPDEVDAALEDALAAGGPSGRGGMDFDAFLRAARLGEGSAAAAEELEAYEPRLRRPAAPPPGEGSAHGRAALPSVPEHTDAAAAL
jgi:hypothetical protein